MQFHHKTPLAVQQKVIGDMSYIRHKNIIDSTLGEAYTRGGLPHRMSDWRENFSLHQDQGQDPGTGVSAHIV
jgi:hypothetical protein